MLSLIYSESLKMLRLWGLLNFDVEIFFPHDLEGLPRGYDKQKSKESDQPHILTSQALLVQVISLIFSLGYVWINFYFCFVLDLNLVLTELDFFKSKTLGTFTTINC